MKITRKAKKYTLHHTPYILHLSVLILKNKYIWLLLLTFLAYGVFEYYRPKPLDWNATYSNKDKIPLGAKATFELLPDLFNNQAIESLQKPVYNHLTESKLAKRSNYVFVNQSFEIDQNDRRELLDYARRGNTVFISAYDFPDTLMRELGVKAELKAPNLRDTALVMNFVNPAFRTASGYVFDRDDGRNYFSVKNPKNVIILAQNARKEPIFLKINHGKGTFYLHNLPLSLTNFYVLDKKTADFTFKCFSYLPTQPVYWDEYQKQGRFGENEQSVFRYIMTQPALRWTYYLALFGLLLFAIFAGKRTQRIIPIVEKPVNASLEFVKTVGQMYLQQGNHAQIAQKKIQHLMLYLAGKFQLNNSVIDDEFLEKLTQKSGLPREEINNLFAEIQQTERVVRLSEYGLLRLNNRIEAFYESLK